MLAGLALAALALVWSMARRLGPPEDEARALAPPRRDYVEAVAAGAGGERRPPRGRRRGGARARGGGSRRAPGLPAGAGEPALREAAARLGLDAAETEAVLGAGDGDELVAGRALARLEAGRR